MSVITTVYNVVSTIQGQPVIDESGLCTDESGSRTTLESKQNGRFELVPIPRRKGLAAKSLDGQTINVETLSGDGIGSMANCVQLGCTEYRYAFPEQPIGPYTGKAILMYRRTWVQLVDS